MLSGASIIPDNDRRPNSFSTLPPLQNLKKHESLGICLGASTVSFVKLTVNLQDSIQVSDQISICHGGNPKTVFLDNLRHLAWPGIPVVVTGRKFRNLVNFKTISESEATENAVALFIDPKGPISAVASLGAETFVVYALDEQGKIRKLISKNQCASGTGDFFLQQITRMQLSVDEAVNISLKSKPFRVSGRCSVFCKSDCTHALNKGIPKDQVASGLALMIAEKAEELLSKVGDSKVMIVGGVTQNKAVIEFLRQKHPHILVPDEAPYFEALGAALYGLYHDIPYFQESDPILVKEESLFTFHKPLAKFTHMVHFYKEVEAPAAQFNL